MSNELKDILSNLNKDIEQEKLLEYLKRRLSDEEQHLVESHINHDPFTSDAMEGLEEMKNPEGVSSAVSELNAGLRKELEKSKRKRAKIVMKDGWFYYAVVLLLVLVIIAFVVIRQLTH